MLSVGPPLKETIMDTETIKILVSAITPILVLIFGVILIKKSESIRREVNQKYDYINAWASNFNLSCGEYLKCIEEYLSLLHFLNQLEDKKNKLGLSIQDRVTQIHIKLPELQLRVRRMAVFAINNGPTLVGLSDEISDYLAKIISTGTGDFDIAINKMHKFSNQSRKCHLEMMGLAKQGDAPERFALLGGRLRRKRK